MVWTQLTSTLELAMQTVYEDRQFRVVSHEQVGECTTIIHNWTIEECTKGQWRPCGREFSKFSAMQFLRDLKKRLH